MFLTALVLALSGCKRTPVQDQVEQVKVQEVKPIPKETMRELLANFSKVHFETDSSEIDEAGKAALEANVSILQQYPTLKVEVQGHADERGTTDYNLALGQRRANAVVAFMTTHGVTPDRLPVVSYGEERPIDKRSGEVAWAQNRRAEFRVIGAPPNVSGTVQ